MSAHVCELDEPGRYRGTCRGKAPSILQLGMNRRSRVTIILPFGKIEARTEHSGGSGTPSTRQRGDTTGTSNISQQRTAPVTTKTILDRNVDELFINLVSDEALEIAASSVKEKANFTARSLQRPLGLPGLILLKRGRNLRLGIQATIEVSGKSRGPRVFSRSTALIRPTSLAPSHPAPLPIHLRRRNPEGEASSSANARRNICRR